MTLADELADLLEQGRCLYCGRDCHRVFQDARGWYAVCVCGARGPRADDERAAERLWRAPIIAERLWRAPKHCPIRCGWKRRGE